MLSQGNLGSGRRVTAPPVANPGPRCQLTEENGLEFGGVAKAAKQRGALSGWEEKKEEEEIQASARPMPPPKAAGAEGRAGGEVS